MQLPTGRGCCPAAGRRPGNPPQAVERNHMIPRVLVAAAILAGPAASEVVVFQPDGALGKDSYTYEVQAGANYGDADTLECGFIGGGQRAVFIEFTELDDPQYEDVTVSSAYLSLYIRQTSATGQIELGAVTTFWDELIIAWDNMPPVVWERAVDTPVGSGWVNWDVTDIVQAWVDGTLDQHGFSIWDTGILPWFSAVSSDDAANPDWRPQLVMSYTQTDFDQDTWGGLKTGI